MQFLDQEKMKFVSIRGWKFWIPVPESEKGKPGVVEDELGVRSPNAGKKIYGYHVNTAEGVLTGIQTKIGKFGRELLLEFDRDTIIQVAFTSAYAEKFLICLPNIDITRTIYFRTWRVVNKKDASKYKTGWNVQQAGKDVAHAVAQRNKDGEIDIEDVPILPDKRYEDVTGNGVKQIIATERFNWLEVNHLNPIIAHLESVKASQTFAANAIAPDDEGPPSDFADDHDYGPPPAVLEDVPF